MDRNARFSLSKAVLSAGISLVPSHSFADLSPPDIINELSILILISILSLLVISGIFLACIKKIVNDKNRLRSELLLREAQADELQEEKQQWLEHEAELRKTNTSLDKQLTAKIETISKVNHDLTKALETLHEQGQSLDSLETAIEFSKHKILIINKHYQVCFASKCFLEFTGLKPSEIKHQPLKRLEKHICLPEMAPNGLSLNDEGLIDTQLKCVDRKGVSHSLKARIALSWSELKEITHYVIIFDN